MATNSDSPDLSLDRTVYYYDAVIAVALTLLALLDPGGRRQPVAGSVQLAADAGDS